MPTLVVTRELARNFSCPSLMNVYCFGENFSPYTCTSNSSTNIRKTLGVYRQPEQVMLPISLLIFQFLNFLFNLYWFRRLWPCFLFLLHIHKVYLYTVPLGSCVVQPKPCAGRLRALLKGSLPVVVREVRTASFSFQIFFYFNYGIQTNKFICVWTIWHGMW